MAIGGESDHQLIVRRHWEKLAKSVDYSFKGLQALAKELSTNLTRTSPLVQNKMKENGSFRPIVHRIAESKRMWKH